MIFWCDLETTGFTELDTDGAKRHKILEIAVVVTNDKFNLLTIGSWVIHHEKEDLLDLMDDVVLKMHTDNGLLEKVEESTVTLAQAEKEILDLLTRLKVQPKTAPLAGNTIFLDRAFIEAQMPELNAHLHYRNLDVSAIYELVKRVCKGFEFPKKKNHRGTDDILESIAEAKFYAEVLQSSREVIRQGPQPDEYDFRSM